MSFLAPFYILGALAVIGPIVFHLIRRTPKGEIPFSSLMFLSPSPPRMTRRSRVDDWLLLLLRALAVGLLAVAFARPFLREIAGLAAPLPEGRRVALLVDTSASMRRGELWDRAVRLASDTIAAGRPGDQLAVIGFDAAPRPVLTFAESSSLDPSRLRAVAADRLRQLSPSWGATDMGRALVEACGALEDLTSPEAQADRMPRRIVLVTDLQRGSDLDALGGFEWPDDIEVEVLTVSDPAPNAGLQWLAAAPEPGAPGATERRLRVHNEEGSTKDKFTLSWDGAPPAPPVEVYVPPGESRVVRIPSPPGADPRGTLVLSGDSQPFDNRLFLAEDAPPESSVVFVGEAVPDDPSGLRYYLDRVFQNVAGRTITVRGGPGAQPIDWPTDQETPLIVLSGGASAANLAEIGRRVAAGATLLLVLKGDTEAVGTLFPGSDFAAEEAPAGRDVMLGSIDFSHPVFAPLAAPQFNDFTKIRFWKHRKVAAEALPGARVVARFEDGDPALLEAPVGQGRVFLLASGWDPADSQLGRSSKFVPLMGQILLSGESRPPGETLLTVQQPIELVPSTSARSVALPGGSVAELAAGTKAFDATAEPGLYTVDPTGAKPRWFAVNLDPSESQTAPLPPEALEQRGCRLARGPAPAPDPDKMRQLRDAELEGRQKIWRWLVVGAVAILIVETFIGGLRAASRRTPTEAATA